MSDGKETILVVEKIDAQKADVIVSSSSGLGRNFNSFYQYHEAEVLDDSSIRVAYGDKSTITFKMNKDLNSLSVISEDKPYWSEGEFKRIPK